MTAGIADLLPLAALVAAAGITSSLAWIGATTVSQRQGEKRLRDFAEAAGDWFWETAVDGRIVYFSAGNEGDGGANGDTGSARANDDPFAMEIKLIEDRIRDASNGRHPFRDFLFSYQSTPDSPLRWMRISGRPVHDASGHYRGHRGVIAEITHEIELANAQAAANPRLLDLLEEIPEAVAIYDADDRLTFCNQKYKRLYPAAADSIAPGVQFGHLVRMNAARHAFAVPDGPELDAWVEERIAAHKLESYIEEHQLVDGRWIQVHERRTADGSVVGVWTDVTEIKKREEALRESEARHALASSHLLNIVETLPEGLAIYDADDRLSLCNERYRELYPIISHLIVPGAHFSDLVRANLEHNAYRDRDLESFLARRIAEHQSTDSTSEQHLSDDRWIQIRERRMKDGSVVGVWSDVTAIKRREEALRESEANYALANSRLLNIVETLPEGIAIFDPDDKLALCNERYREVFPKISDLIVPGVQFEYLVRTNLERGTFNLSGVDGESYVANRIRQHRNAPSLTEVHLSDGRWIQIRKERMRDGGIVGVWTDVTEIKDREEALRESEERYALAVEGTNEGLWHWDVMRDEVYLAPRLAAMMGTAALDSKQARSIYGLHVHPEDLHRRRQAFRDHIKGRTAFYTCEYRLRGADGSYLWVRDCGLGQRDEQGRVFRMAGSVSDITERKNHEVELRLAKEQAELANRTKTEFLANVSHELRTPLNAVIGFSDIIRHELMGPVGEPKYREYAEDIYQSGNHLLEVINDILDVAKVEAGKAELHEEVVDISECAEAALRLVQQRAVANGLSLEARIPNDLPPLRADERKIKQILINLLSNSIKFTQSGGQVAITAALAPSGGLRLAVRDTGIGIAEEDIPKALSPFGQVESHLGRKHQGTGLGLSLVQTLARMHDASFELTSQTGQGTTVTLEFPPARIVPVPQIAAVS